MLKACILDYASLAPKDLHLESLWALPLQWQLHDSTQAAQTAERIAGMSVVLSNKVILDRALLEANPSIKLIIILATGTNNVDLQAAADCGIAVCNIVGYSTEAVVQQTFTMLLALNTHLLKYHQAVQDGLWSDSEFFGLLEYPVHELNGKTLGIIGFGSIGKRVKQVAEVFGMQVIVAESLSGASHSDRVSLDTLYSQADVISVHSPLTPESNNLIDAKALAQMKPSTLLLNMGRGGIINEADLEAALRNGTIRGAALDVLAQEPPAKDHPLLQKDIPNLLVLPHIGWASVEARQALVGQVEKILQALPNGPFINRVMP